MKNLIVLSLLATLILTGALTGCTTTVVVEGSVPTPLVRKIPARIGIYYGEDFKTFQHTEALEAEGTWKINFGDQNLTFFRNLMESLFESVTELPNPQPGPETAATIDAVLIPQIVKYGFLTPGLSGLNFFSASIHYRITMVDMAGNELADWTVVGYGKSEGGVFGGDSALGEATMLAIRDGGARISIDLTDQPEVAKWIDRQGATDNEN
ncbi:MAG: hypothetical protein ACJAXW_003323 [Candidatus Azotimanducaceae bacterium]|jgi:hypothetical protein